MPLSDEEFNDLLQKRLAASGNSALDGEDAQELSEEDEADLAIMREALGNYKAETMEWAERRSAVMPVPRPGVSAVLWDLTPRWVMAGVAVSACAIAAVSVVHGPADGGRSAVSAVAPDAQVLAADNQLLTSVDDALALSGSTPSEQELGLSSSDLSTHAQDSQRHGRTQNAIN